MQQSSFRFFYFAPSILTRLGVFEVVNIMKLNLVRAIEMQMFGEKYFLGTAEGAENAELERREKIGVGQKWLGWYNIYLCLPT